MAAFQISLPPEILFLIFEFLAEDDIDSLGSPGVRILIYLVEVLM